MVSAQPRNEKTLRGQGPALALLAATFVLFSAFYFRAPGFEEPSEYEPRPQVQISSCLGYAPRPEKASISSVIAWVPTLHIHAIVVTVVRHILATVHLYGSWLIRAPPMFSPL